MITSADARASDMPVTTRWAEAEHVSRSATTSSYSITMRLHTAPDHGVVGAVATAISQAGGIVTAIDVAESSHERLVVDVTCSAGDADHAQELQDVAAAVPGVEVYRTSDRVFLLHIGGKIEVGSKVPLKNRDDLSMAYTPGVGRVSMALYENPEDVRRLTIKGNSVAVVTDGSAVLGLGNIGPRAALPVMEALSAEIAKSGRSAADLEAWAPPRLEHLWVAGVDVPVRAEGAHGLVRDALREALRAQRHCEKLFHVFNPSTPGDAFAVSPEGTPRFSQGGGIRHVASRPALVDLEARGVIRAERRNV